MANEPNKTQPTDADVDAFLAALPAAYAQAAKAGLAGRLTSFGR